jgi:glycosyltransferase involved in cell wall biosynthesis
VSASTSHTTQIRKSAVVIAMKAQLRGRFRRNVLTLLEMGLHTTVIMPKTKLDPMLGLAHPNLKIILVETYSILNIYQNLNRKFQKFRISYHLSSQKILSFLFCASLARKKIVKVVLGTQGLAEVFKVLKNGLYFKSQWRGNTWDYYFQKETKSKFTRVPDRAKLKRKFIFRLLLPLHRPSRWFHFWLSSYQITIRAKPDLIWTSDLPGLVGGSRAAAKLSKPHVHDCHEIYLESTGISSFEKKLFSRLERYYIRKADLRQTVNNSIAEELQRRFSCKFFTILNASVDTGLNADSDIRKDTNLATESIIAVYTGGFMPGRGLPELIKGFINQQAKEVFLVLLGYGELEGELKDLAKGSPHIIFLPPVAPDLLLSYISTADIGLIPYEPVNLNNKLSLPNKIFEYSNAGLAICATDLPEITKVVELGLGKVFPPYKSSDAYQICQNMVVNLSEYKEKSRNWSIEHSWENEKTKLISNITAVINQA